MVIAAPSDEFGTTLPYGRAASTSRDTADPAQQGYQRV